MASQSLFWTMKGDPSGALNTHLQRMALCWIENNNGWIYVSENFEVLFEYVMHIFRVYT
jgi:hypothetical protein